VRCKETSGILFNHPCADEATLSCVRCHKPICERHMRYHQDKPHCVGCVRQMVQEERQAGRSHAAGRYADDPYFFYYYSRPGTSDAYGADDFALFEGGDDEAALAYATEDDGAWVGS
jgi:hypothetical protein